MNILLTLDYELFLGAKTGSIENCLIRPLEAYLQRIEKYGVRFTIFVDATFLYKLKMYASQYENAADDYEKISTHIKELQLRGHEIQLHIHPHWFYSTYDGMEWHLDHQHYKLSDLPMDEAEKMFSLSKSLLDEIVGHSTMAFRAGGFSVQPTEIVLRLFNQNGIKIDSSVLPGNSYNSPQQKYDYLNSPNKEIYRFQDDICMETLNGEFLEIPITTSRLSPLFYWKLVITRLFKMKKHQLYGDGCAVQTTSESIIERLTKPTLAMATIDGFKINYLHDIYSSAKQRNQKYMCVIGHPKLTTNYSINKLEEFCCNVIDNGDRFITISECYE